MKHFIIIPALILVAPNVAHAQLEIVLSGARPVLRANIGGVRVSAGVGSTGRLDVRVDEGRMARTTAPRSRGAGTRASAGAAAVLRTADAYVGTRYVWGGESPSGFDCSGFVQYVFRQHGIALPRTSRQPAQVGQSIPTAIANLEVGDLMLFATNGSRIDHIAIYAGNDQIIHSSSTGGGVGYDRFDSKRGRFFLSHHIATRRVLANGHDLVGLLAPALRRFVGYDPPDRAPAR